MRITIVFKNIQSTASDLDDETIAELYPDTAKFKEEEQRRFELIVERLDVPVRVEDPADWTEAKDAK